jgi:hypothetical protein
VEDNPETEYIADWIALSFKVLKVDDFRGNVARRAAPHKQVLRFVGPSRQSEISDYAVKVALLSHQNILRLEVAMHNSALVHVLQSHEQPSNCCLNLVGSEFVFGFDLVIELTALEKFDAYVDGVLTFVDLE